MEEMIFYMYKYPDEKPPLGATRYLVHYKDGEWQMSHWIDEGRFHWNDKHIDRWAVLPGITYEE